MKRKVWLKQSRQENLIYLAVWGLLFAAPLLSLYVRTTGEANAVFDWTGVFIVWKRLSVFLLLFLAHNFLLAPLLIHGQNRIAYFSVVAVIVAAFTFYQCTSRPDIKEPMGHEPPLGRLRGQPDRHRPLPPPIIGEHDVLAVVMLVLMFGVNLGIKGYFRSRDDQRRLAELERESLGQQLEYLRYQINPHFFMNTLNNIHALVDIDREKAKETIVELSKMMRYVLYEGDKQCVPLSYELDFIRHYVALMQLRYTEKVKITLDLPPDAAGCQIPPLVLVTFIENAFKHGVSYQHESFIGISASVANDKLLFSCCNSKANQPNREEGGVGLANVRKRLDLLYAGNYTLDINDTEDIYFLHLVIPLES